MNVFIAKYDASGNFLWAKYGAGSTYYYNAAFEVAVDNAGDAYVTGQYGGAYSGGITFAPLPAMNSAGGWDMFVVKYNSAGVAQWQTTVGSVLFGWNSEGGNGIAVDQSGNVYVTGNFNGSEDYPTYFGNIPLVSNGGGGFYESNFFLAKYNPSSSSWEWAVEGGGSQNDWGKKLSLDMYNNLYVDGYFEGTVAFGTSSMTSAGPHDYFIAKYSPDGDLTWIHPTGGSGAGGNSSKADANGNFYFAGIFQGTETVGNVTLTTLGYINAYVASWNSNGIFQWVKFIPAGYYALVRNIEVESNGNIDIIGTLAGAETFDCITLNSVTNQDLTVAKLGISNDGPDAPTISASANPVCDGANTTLSITSGNINNAIAWKWYAGSCGGTLIGSGTSITVSPVENTTYYVRGEGGCTGNGNCGSITVAISNTPPVIACPANITVAPTSLTGAVVNYITPAGSDDCGNTTTVQTTGSSSGSTFPIGATTNSFEVTDNNGNKATCSFTITVSDPYCDKNSNEQKVYVCHNGNTICISVNALQTHLDHGDYLGPCTTTTLVSSRGIVDKKEITVSGFTIKTLPNPTNRYFTITTQSADQKSSINLKVINVYGQVIENRNNIAPVQTVKIGGNYRPGIYFLEIIQGANRKVIKLVKQ